MSASANNWKLLILSSASFATGLAAGLLFTPASGEENRRRLQDSSGRAIRWIDEKYREIRQAAIGKWDKIREIIPNPYSATEHLHLDKDDLLTRSHA